MSILIFFIVLQFNIKEFAPLDIVNQKSCITCDGKYIYAIIGRSLLKVGTGYSGTLKGFVYGINKEFVKDKTGWIGMCNVSNLLYHKDCTQRIFFYCSTEYIIL